MCKAHGAGPVSIGWPSDAGGYALGCHDWVKIRGAFVGVVHSPGKAQHYLTYLDSGKSNNLIAVYDLVNDTL